MGKRSTSILVGRDGIAVPDPLNKYRLYLPDEVLRVVEREAAILGATYVRAGDAELEQRTRGGALFADLDRERAEESARWSNYEEEAEREVLQAREEVYLVECQRTDLDPRTFDAHKANLQRAVRVCESNLKLIYVDRPDRRYIDHWVDGKLGELVEWTAAERERAFRHAPAVDEPAVDGAMSFREIGPGAHVAPLVEERVREQYDAAYGGNYDPGLGEGPTPRLTADRLAELLGKQRAQALSARIAPLRDWAVRQPDWWVREQHATYESGERGFDGRVAATAARLDRTYARYASERGVAHHEKTMARIDAERSTLRGLNSHPAHWMRARETMLAAAYDDAFKIQLAAKIGREIEAGRGSSWLVSQIGPAPSQHTLGRPEYERVERQLLEDRCVQLAAVRENLPPPDRSPLERQALDASVASLREKQGLESLPPAHAAQRITARDVGVG